MPKSTDVPVELRDFNNIFEQISRRHDYSNVFSAYLIMMLNFFANGEFMEDRDKEMARFDQEEKDGMNKLFYETLKIQNEMIVVREMPWYDPFGEFYQAITSSGKASGMGQFFTPPYIVDLMVQLSGAPANSEGQNINDPCCGSGRMLLASHALNPKNFHYGQDLDLMCCQMTVINMCMHGCRGEVIWGDTLRMSFNRGWLINNSFAPRIQGLPQEQSRMSFMNENQLKEAQAEKTKVEAEAKEKLDADIRKGLVKQKRTKTVNKQTEISFD